jgi:long-chain acyl-CoA synthetase
MEESCNLVKIYEHSFRKHFDLPALSDYGTDKIYTYKDVAVAIEKLHILFEANGIKQKDKIALVGKNCSYWGIIFMATVTYGAVIVPILQDFSFDDVQHIVNHSDSTLLFATDSILKNLEKEKMPALKALFAIVDNGLSGKDGVEALDEELSAKFSAKFPSEFTPEDINYSSFPDNQITILNYTSGTTGFSKGVLITADNLVGNLLFAHNEIELRTGHKLLSLLPLAHTYGCAFEFLFPIMEGCHVTLLGKTPAPNILMKAFALTKPNLIISVPLILEKIYKGMILPMVSKPALRIALKLPILNGFIYKIIRKKLMEAFGNNFIQIVIGGAPLNKEVENFLLKIKFPVSVGYGMTECAPLVSFSLYENYIKYSSGKLLPCMQARIDSPDPFHIAGEIQLKGQNVMVGYYKNEEATQAVFTDDGWLRTGDLGTIDKDNNIFIRGRSKSMLLGASGQNIYPEEIEAKLANLPYVQESLVVHKNGKLVALVVPDYDAAKAANINAQNLQKIMVENRSHLNNMLASYEKITEFQLVEKEFEKTPKKSIKRYLYTNS